MKISEVEEIINRVKESIEKLNERLRKGASLLEEFKEKNDEKNYELAFKRFEKISKAKEKLEIVLSYLESEIPQDQGLIRVEYLGEICYFALDNEWKKKAPEGAVVYTLSELEALKGTDERLRRLIHEAKKQGGETIQVLPKEKEKVSVEIPCIKGVGLCSLRTSPEAEFDCIFDPSDCQFKIETEDLGIEKEEKEEGGEDV